MRKKIVYFDLDGVMADYDSAISYKDDPSVPMNGFFANLKPIDGAIDAFIRISEDYDCFFLTTAPWSNPYALTDKRLWVENHLGVSAFKKLITSHRKDLLIGDYLIDDRKVNGAEDFIGVHIHFGQGEFKDWESVVNFLIDSHEKENSSI